MLPEVDVLSSLCQQSVYHAGVFFARVHCSAFFSTVCAILGSNQRECKQEVQLGLFSVSHGKAATPTSRGDCWITVAVLQCKPIAYNSVTSLPPAYCDCSCSLFYFSSIACYRAYVTLCYHVIMYFCEALTSEPAR